MCDLTYACRRIRWGSWRWAACPARCPRCRALWARCTRSACASRPPAATRCSPSCTWRRTPRSESSRSAAATSRSGSLRSAAHPASRSPQLRARSDDYCTVLYRLISTVRGPVDGAERDTLRIASTTQMASETDVLHRNRKASHNITCNAQWDKSLQFSSVQQRKRCSRLSTVAVFISTHSLTAQYHSFAQLLLHWPNRDETGGLSCCIE